MLDLKTSDEKFWPQFLLSRAMLMLEPKNWSYLAGVPVIQEYLVGNQHGVGITMELVTLVSN